MMGWVLLAIGWGLWWLEEGQLHHGAYVMPGASHWHLLIMPLLTSFALWVFSRRQQ